MNLPELNASELLRQIELAGGTATIKHENEIVKLNVAPVQVALKFTYEAKRLKSALIDLLLTATLKEVDNPVEMISPLIPACMQVDVRGDSAHSESSLLKKGESHGAHLWLGATTVDGIECPTPEEEFDNSITLKWYGELQQEKKRIRAEIIEAKKIENKAFWEVVTRDRAMMDALSAKLGPNKVTQAIYLATGEILERWRGIVNEEPANAIQRAALELLCLRNEIDFDDLGS